MKNRFLSIVFSIAAVLGTFAFPAALVSSSVVLTGCGTLDPGGSYKGDEILYRADVAITTSYNVLHTFVQFEYENRALLASQPEVKKAADNVRLHAKEWITSAIALREAYAANPTPENRKSLETAISVLRTALNEATKYLIQNQPPPKP